MRAWSGPLLFAVPARIDRQPFTADANEGIVDLRDSVTFFRVPHGFSDFSKTPTRVQSVDVFLNVRGQDGSAGGIRVCLLRSTPAFTFRNLVKIGLCGAAVYYSVVEGVWSTSDQSVGPVSKVKHRLLPQAFQFVSDVSLLPFFNTTVFIVTLSSNGFVEQRLVGFLRSRHVMLLFRRFQGFQGHEPIMSRSNVLQFLSMCGRLKHTVRTGWTRYDINQPESVADHMYRMALMATVIPTSDQTGISVERLIKMTIVHDLAESVVGDITPYCNVSKEEKARRESNAMADLCNLLPKDNAEEVLNLWNTPEARLCKDFDKFDMILQAFEYEKETQRPGMLEEFFTSTLGCFTTPMVQSLVKELYEQRQEFQADK
ncbi:HD domain protein [Opisthorchis viverrini]|uniref:5'-deoxynucleotidase HDDC2 n=1 Tax=Opisthorchis viverrini TaxID=6198 RepID=A0A1S8WWD8_OPIVI|nr:HD domain protein [Opisthorchis viverrini]